MDEGPFDELDLALAHPPASLLPSSQKVLQWTEQFVQAHGDAGLFPYGEHAGLAEARIVLAQWLSDLYQQRWEPSGLEMVFCAGVSGGLDVVGRRLDQWLDGSKMGKTVLIEEATYEAVPPILEAAGLNVVRIKSDKNGIDLDDLEVKVRERRTSESERRKDQQHDSSVSIEKSLKEEQKEDLSVRFVYVIPTHHNPTGTTISLENRKRLIELSRDLHFYIVSDEVYTLLEFPDQDLDFVPPNKDKKQETIPPQKASSPPPNPSVSFTPFSALSETAMSIFSVSKFLSPGFRVGWIHSTCGDLRTHLAESPVAFSGGSPVPALVSAAVAGAALTGDLTHHVVLMRQHLAERASVLYVALTQLLEGKNAKVWPCTGGYFLWVELPSVDETEGVVQRLERRKPPVYVGTLPGVNGLRLCFAALDKIQLQHAATAIAAEIKD